MIRFAGFEDTETQVDEFSHGGAESSFLSLAPCHEAFVKGFNVRVITDGGSVPKVDMDSSKMIIKTLIIKAN